MEIIETRIFTEKICNILTDDEYDELQNYLVKEPTSGDIIKGSGDLKKLRWKLKTSGKSGGIRNIYYYIQDRHQIYMIYVYCKLRKTQGTAFATLKASNRFLMPSCTKERLLSSISNSSLCLSVGNTPSKKHTSK